MSKDKEFTRLNKKLFDYIKDAEKGPQEGMFELVRDKMLANAIMKSNGLSNVSDKVYDSAYANNIIDDTTKEYTSFRVASHYPKNFNTILSKFPEGHPTTREYGHMCILLFGSYEQSKIEDRSMRGNYMLPQKLKVTIDTQKYYQRIKDYFNSETRIPYHFYHYVPSLLSDADVVKICESAGRWFNGKGYSEFEWPMPNNKNARPLTKPIESVIWFKMDYEKLNETVSIVGNPLDRVHLYSIDFTNNKKINIHVDVYMDFTKCEPEALPLVLELANMYNNSETNQDKNRY